MKFYLDNKTQYDINKKIFERITHSAFKKFGYSDKVEIGLIVTGNREIKKLNKKYRRVDRATDVLSFPIDTPQKKQDNYLMLGDIVISADEAKRETEKLGNSFDQTMVILFKHGLLHLLGFNHEKNKKEWQSAERKILGIGA